MRHPPKALLLDMDGVLYHGEQVLPHALTFMHAVANIPHLFLSNNPIRPPEAVADRLQRIGFERPPAEHILTSAIATARHLAQRKSGFRYYAIGAPGLDAALSRLGEAATEDVDFVVVGEGPGLDFDSLTLGINLIIKQGATLISTNPDASVDAHVDGEHRVLPGGGALVAPFEVATGRKAETIGKPRPLLYRMALGQLGCQPQDCVMIGDRVDTDVAGAQALGIPTALVRTGRFAPGDPWPAGQARADWDVTGLDELLALWRRQWPLGFDADTGLQG